MEERIEAGRREDMRQEGEGSEGGGLNCTKNRRKFEEDRSEDMRQEGGGSEGGG